jgi:DNA-binding beta-propeller fold protein YncE
VKSFSNGIAVSRDGCTLLVSDEEGGSNAIHVYDVADGSPRRVIGGPGDGPLQFKNPRQVYIAPDDFVFIADYRNDRVQVLTPQLDFHSFVGVGQLRSPAGVCANADVVVVCEWGGHRVSVFNRSDGALLRRIGSSGNGDGQLKYPCGLCFLSDERHVAVADDDNHRISVFSIDGAFVRHVGVGVLKGPRGVGCSTVDELIVADFGNNRVSVFRASGELLTTVGGASFSGIAVHDGTAYAQAYSGFKCTLYR